MVLECLRCTYWGFRHLLLAAGLCFAIGDRLDAALDLTNIVQIPIEPCLVRGWQAILKADSLFDDGVQDASVLTFARKALFGRAAVAEEFFKDDLRAVFHRQRNRGCAPGNG